MVTINGNAFAEEQMSVCSDEQESVDTGELMLLNECN